MHTALKGHTRHVTHCSDTAESYYQAQGEGLIGKKHGAACRPANGQPALHA